MEAEIVNIAGTEGKWRYIECSTTVGGVVNSSNTRGCQVCGNKNWRFCHTLVYPKKLGRIPGTFENYIFVGVECAGLLIDGDPDIPRLAENETARKERWRIRYGTSGTCRTTIDNLIERGKL